MFNFFSRKNFEKLIKEIDLFSYQIMTSPNKDSYLSINESLLKLKIKLTGGKNINIDENDINNILSELYLIIGNKTNHNIEIINIVKKILNEINKNIFNFYNEVIKDNNFNKDSFDIYYIKTKTDKSYYNGINLEHLYKFYINESKYEKMNIIYDNYINFYDQTVLKNKTELEKDIFISNKASELYVNIFEGLKNNLDNVPSFYQDYIEHIYGSKKLENKNEYINLFIKVSPYYTKSQLLKRKEHINQLKSQNEKQFFINLYTSFDFLDKVIIQMLTDNKTLSLLNSKNDTMYLIENFSSFYMDFILDNRILEKK